MHNPASQARLKGIDKITRLLNIFHEFFETTILVQDAEHSMKVLLIFTYQSGFPRPFQSLPFYSP
ncbi:MAG: hypothetical protein DSZ23_06030 [Thermodesulfatator sp.]|nr:MAG: hypothetical protein DSZ23_06030 [Thermodesulfatator sp.]